MALVLEVAMSGNSDNDSEFAGMTAGGKEWDGFVSREIANMQETRVPILRACCMHGEYRCDAACISTSCLRP